MGDDRRRSLRVRVNEEFAQIDGALSEYVANLSRGGVFLRCDELLPLGMEVELRFTVLLDDIETIEGRGKVVHHGHDGVVGLGITFTELTPRSRELIERFHDE